MLYIYANEIIALCKSIDADFCKELQIEPVPTVARFETLSIMSGFDRAIEAREFKDISNRYANTVKNPPKDALTFSSKCFLSNGADFSSCNLNNSIIPQLSLPNI